MENIEQLLAKANILSEALPYIKKFAGETFVIKYGGNAMDSKEVIDSFASNVVLLKKIGINPIIVHGGGPQIGNMLEKLKIKSSFVQGLRVTDKETVEIVEMVLCGSINKEIVSYINKAGGLAIGISGKDGNLAEATKVRRLQKDPDSNIEKILDLGFVGEVSKINPEILDILYESDLIPVIAPIGVSSKGETYNINADSFAGALASAIGANKLIMLSNIDGLLDKKKKLIKEIDCKQAKEMLSDGSVDGGMIPKLETCIKAVENNVESAHILNGLIPHILLVEVFTEKGVGTMIHH